MGKELLSLSKKNQCSENIVKIDKCDTYKKVEATVNMCSYFSNNPFSISFSPCEIDKTINITTQVSCNSFRCSYIDSLINSASFSICEESCCNCCDDQSPNNKCSATPCNCVHEVFIDASECKEDLDIHSEDHYCHSELDSEDTVSEEKISDYNIVTNHIEEIKNSHKEESNSDLSISALIPLIAMLLKDSSNKDINKDRISDNTTSPTHIKARKDSNKKKSDPQLSMALLAALIDMFLKNSSNKTSNEEDYNEKEDSKKHKKSKHRKRHKRNKNYKQDANVLNYIIALIILGVISQIE